MSTTGARQAPTVVRCHSPLRPQRTTLTPPVRYAAPAPANGPAAVPVQQQPTSAPPTVHPPVTQAVDVRRVIKTISELLKDRDVLKKAVVQCFKKVNGGTDNINLAGLQQFRIVLSNLIQVPTDAFGDLVNTYICFDFDGNGALEVNETYKLVKFHLREYRKKLGGGEAMVDMPNRSLQEAGYQVIKELGRGSQGIVKLASNREGKEVCVKCLKKDQMSCSGIEELQEEFHTLQQLCCERIANVYELFQDSQNYYMVGEPYHGGDFMTLKMRARAQGVTMSERWLQGVLRQCFDAVAFMHEQAMMHCDIKEPNIMLKTSDFQNPEVVLIDFGVSRAMAAKPNGMPGGTPGYIPPETLETHKWFPRGDIFSLGVTIMQVMVDKIPPTGPRSITTPGGIFVEGCMTIKDIMQATVTREPPFHLMPALVPGLTKLLKAMLSKQMQPRPTARAVLNDPWFQEQRSSPASVRSKNPWATVGITKSFLARPSVAGEDLPPALAALREVQRTVSVDEAPSAAQPLTRRGQLASPSISRLVSGTNGHTALPSALAGSRNPGQNPVQKRLVIAA